LSSRYIDGDKLYQFPGTKFWLNKKEHKKVESEWAASVETYLLKRRNDFRTVLMAWNSSMPQIITRNNLRVGVYVPPVPDLIRNIKCRNVSEPERLTLTKAEILDSLKNYVKAQEAYETIMELDQGSPCLLACSVVKHLGSFLESPGGFSKVLLRVSTLLVDRLLTEDIMMLVEQKAHKNGFTKIVFLTGYAKIGEIAEAYVDKEDCTLLVFQVDAEIDRSGFIEMSGAATLVISDTEVRNYDEAKVKCPSHPYGCLNLQLNYRCDVILAVDQIRTMVSILDNATRVAVVRNGSLRSRLRSALPAYLQLSEEASVMGTASSVILIAEPPKNEFTYVEIDEQDTDEGFIAAMSKLTQMVPWVHIPWDKSRAVLKPACESARSASEWMDLFNGGASLCVHDMPAWAIRYQMLTKKPGVPITCLHPEGNSLPESDEFRTVSWMGCRKCMEKLGDFIEDAVCDQLANPFRSYERGEEELD